LGRTFENSYVLIPEKDIPEYVKILQIIGDSYQMLDNLYDAADTYQKALEIDADNIDTLLKLKRNLRKRDESSKIDAIDQKLKSLISPRIFVADSYTLGSGEYFADQLITDGGEILLSLEFEREKTNRPQLVTISCNGRVEWEDYLNIDNITVTLDTKPGRNLLKIDAINEALMIKNIQWQTIR
jgi:tetratricopeptide (TPR) repeat protein